MTLPHQPLGRLRDRPGCGQALLGAGGGGRGRDYKSQAALRARQPCGAAGLKGGGSAAAPRRWGPRRWRLERGLAMLGPGARAEDGSTGEGAAPGAAAEPGAGPGREPARLCGYLQKLSGKGPLRGYRSRWFVFDARRCYLYYFKNPQDAQPLGHLDIADACFSYTGPDEAAEPGAETPAHFQVHSAGAVTVLKVGQRAPQPRTRLPGARPHALPLLPLPSLWGCPRCPAQPSSSDHLTFCIPSFL